MTKTERGGEHCPGSGYVAINVCLHFALFPMVNYRVRCVTGNLYQGTRHLTETATNYTRHVRGVDTCQ